MTARELLRAVAKSIEEGEYWLVGGNRAGMPCDNPVAALRALADRIDGLIDNDALTDACYAADVCADNVEAILRVVQSRLDADLG